MTYLLFLDFGFFSPCLATRPEFSPWLGGQNEHFSQSRASRLYTVEFVSCFNLAANFMTGLV
jgi:hypothetical protein